MNMRYVLKEVSVPSEAIEQKVNQYFSGTIFGSPEELIYEVEEYVKGLVMPMVGIEGVALPSVQLKSIHVDSGAMNDYLRDKLVGKNYESIGEIEEYINKTVRESIEEFTHFSVG